MICNYCNNEDKLIKVSLFHYAAFLCSKCKKSLMKELEDVGWKYLKVKRANETNGN